MILRCSTAGRVIIGSGFTGISVGYGEPGEKRYRSLSMKRKLSCIAMVTGLLCLAVTGCVTTIDGEKFNRTRLKSRTDVLKISDLYRDESIPLEQHALLYVGVADGRQLRIPEFDGKYAGLLRYLATNIVGLIPPGSHQLLVKELESTKSIGTITYEFEPGKLYMLTGDWTDKAGVIEGTIRAAFGFGRRGEYAVLIVSADEDIAAADKREKILWDVRMKNIDAAMEAYRKKNP
jgi:hypothetical protein